MNLEERINEYLKKSHAIIIKPEINDTILAKDKYVLTGFCAFECELAKKLDLQIYGSGNIHFVDISKQNESVK